MLDMEVKGSEEDLDPLSGDLPPQAAVSGSRAIGGGPHRLSAPRSHGSTAGDDGRGGASKLPLLLAWIRRRRGWEWRIRRILPLPHGSCRLFGPLSCGSTVDGDGRGGSGDLFPSRTYPRLLSTRLSRGSVGGGDGRGGSGDLFPSRTDPIVSSRRRRQEGRKRQPPHCCQFRPLPHRKIGYGTASEALACKLQFIFVRRDYFNEEPFLRILLEHYQSSIEMTRREFLNGYWKLYLLRALTLEPCYDGPTNGGEEKELDTYW
ncbi:uncharacterized protein [Oryza sativa Japonica Group]|nr:uncharacterized protein LOC112938230 [Oryza sativa Japonica Group]